MDLPPPSTFAEEVAKANRIDPYQVEKEISRFHDNPLLHTILKAKADAIIAEKGRALEKVKPDALLHLQGEISGIRLALAAIFTR